MKPPSLRGPAEGGLRAKPSACKTAGPRVLLSEYCIVGNSRPTAVELFVSPRFLFAALLSQTNGA